MYPKLNNQKAISKLNIHCYINKLRADVVDAN